MSIHPELKVDQLSSTAPFAAQAFRLLYAWGDSGWVSCSLWVSTSSMNTHYTTHPMFPLNSGKALNAEALDICAHGHFKNDDIGSIETPSSRGCPILRLWHLESCFGSFYSKEQVGVASVSYLAGVVLVKTSPSDKSLSSETHSIDPRSVNPWFKSDVWPDRSCTSMALPLIVWYPNCRNRVHGHNNSLTEFTARNGLSRLPPFTFLIKCLSWLWKSPHVVLM